MLRIRAYAKLNLSLKILGKRPDGFHELASIMQSISLHDLITLEAIPSGIQLTTDSLQLTTDGRNLAYRAAEVFQKAGIRNLACRQAGQKSEHGVRIDLKKNIPLAAGLAGGSADAAAVLYGLNQMLNVQCPMSNVQLMELGSQIGSDVPFCLVGGNCLVKGRGERVRRLATRNPQPGTYYVLVVPEVEVSTKWAYAAWDAERMSNVQCPMSNEGTGNDLEPVVIGKYPVVREIKEKLLNLGCSFAQMSGSGPGVFGEAAERVSGEEMVFEMKKEFPKSYLVRAVERGVELC
ncbi:4-(cytidine 5'-diphospho)-2-C-methyl-D-erythritol kinase [Candidatus Saganbacteria bacterium]|uniref:4-diphosphocytidyl-2-C-methyl-D-erythritol kinase n=1 Tax=Candidatus Saganbacteria bacterium TaxID=2575572 RepID=A0A9D6ULF3_UNCSA|nr:4-(cytidine 5'-diphospho)-2-C-methyl-D-erythritol kinase [Candidatus Saganbacteria bacterium]